MDQEKHYDFFVDGKLDLRKLRHDMAGALGIVKHMLQLSAQYPERRSSEYDPLMQQAVDRLDQIAGSLREKTNSNQKGSRADLVDTVDKH